MEVGFQVFGGHLVVSMREAKQEEDLGVGQDGEHTEEEIRRNMGEGETDQG